MYIYWSWVKSRDGACLKMWLYPVATYPPYNGYTKKLGIIEILCEPSLILNITVN